MNKYIDAEKLKAEIERFSATEYGDNTFGDDIANGALDYVLEEIIPSLQQEQPEVPHWKPSVEQMGALNYAYGELFKREDVGHNILGPLQNLIDTLRKL